MLNSEREIAVTLTTTVSINNNSNNNRGELCAAKWNIGYALF